MGKVVQNAGTLSLTVKHDGRRIVDRQPIAFQHGKTLEETILQPAKLEFKDVGLGHRITRVLGLESEWYHFFLLDQQGRKAIPYAHREGKRVYLDMRNIALGQEFNGMELELSVVSCNCDFSHSVTERIDDIFATNEILFHQLEDAKSAAREFVQKGIRNEFAIEPNYFLRMLLAESRMSLRKLRDLYMRKLLEPEFYPSFNSSLIALSNGNRRAEEIIGVEEEISFQPGKPTQLLAGFQRLHFRAAEQRKRERARIKELGPRAAANEKEKLAALEEDIKKRSLQLEALMLRNLETARSSFDCPAALAS